MERFIKSFYHMKFSPSGITDDPEVRMAPSIPAYVMRRIAHDLYSKEQLINMGLMSPESSSPVQVSHHEDEDKPINETLSGNLCGTCGTPLIRTGKCEYCPSCEESTGGCE
jgi:ribonucleoside-diphosphate reductase alpha chain